MLLRPRIPFRKNHSSILNDTSLSIFHHINLLVQILPLTHFLSHDRSRNTLKVFALNGLLFPVLEAKLKHFPELCLIGSPAIVV